MAAGRASFVTHAAIRSDGHVSCGYGSILWRCGRRGHHKMANVLTDKFVLLLILYPTSV